MNVKKRTFEIETGSTRDEIVDSFKYTYSKKSSVSVEFVAYRYPAIVNQGTRVNRSPMLITGVKVTSIRYDKKCDEVYIITGTCRAEILSVENMSNERTYEFEAHYNTKNLKGTISLYE